MNLRAIVGALCLACSLSSCVRLRWNHENRFEPLPSDSWAGLEPGESDLGDALESLGAPLYVWEQTSDSFAVAYGWFNGRVAGGTVSVPLTEYASASFSYDNGAEKLYGLVLTFDRNERLMVLREGYLRDIAPELVERHPSFDPNWVEDAPSD